MNLSTKNNNNILQPALEKAVTGGGAGSDCAKRNSKVFLIVVDQTGKISISRFFHFLIKR